MFPMIIVPDREDSPPPRRHHGYGGVPPPAYFNGPSPAPNPYYNQPNPYNRPNNYHHGNGYNHVNQYNPANDYYDDGNGSYDEAPAYDYPVFQDVTQGSQRLQAATIKFPPSLVIISSFSLKGNVHLGVHEGDKRYFLSPPKLIRQKGSILYDGPDKHCRIIGEAEPLRTLSSRSLIKVHPCPENGRNGVLEVIMDGPSSSRQGFTLPPYHHKGGGAGHPEQFEWRTSRGKEMRDMNNGRRSHGWKLVRLSGPGYGAGGSRDVRDRGFSSDGFEIVAIGAHTSKWKTGPKFAYMGSGLTGTLGPDFEIVALMSFLRLYELERQRSAAAASTSTAGAAV